MALILDVFPHGAANSVPAAALDGFRDDRDDGVAAFMNVRLRLIGIARRMLGDATEAEDVVQDVWLRWQMTDRTAVRDVPAFLVTTATRLAINVMQSARSRRVTLVGAFTTEPTAAGSDPASDVHRAQALACAVPRLLRTLTPMERAVYILRESFEYSYREIARVLSISEANARQIVTRARKHVSAATTRRSPERSDDEAHAVRAMFAAAGRGDVPALERLVAASVRPRFEDGADEPVREYAA
jgi:RNA polymerase sigma-70 factor (ECF subfamily)